MMTAKQKEEYEKSRQSTLQLFRQGHSLPEIAHKRKFAVSTIENHIQRLIEDGKLKINEVLDKEKFELIKKNIGESKFLREIKERLPEEISYGDIKWVLTSLGKLRTRNYPIETAVNTYMGNYCSRKCFNNLRLMFDCAKKFRNLKEKMKATPITFKEFKDMINSDEIKICKLPVEKRRRYVSWRYFEYLQDKKRDFWQI